jgi:hypothetical protein
MHKDMQQLLDFGLERKSFCHKKAPEKAHGFEPSPQWRWGAIGETIITLSKTVGVAQSFSTIV